VKKIAAAARAERPFPVPINVNTRRTGKKEQDKNEKRALQKTNITASPRLFQRALRMSVEFRCSTAESSRVFAGCVEPS
jgi:hypothetical protein